MRALVASAVASFARAWTERWLKRLSSSPPAGEPSLEGPTSLYLHFPFCRRPCRFCHFVRYPYDDEKARKYYKKLMKDVEEAFTKGAEVFEAYIGGGSPSATPDLLGELLDLLWSLWRPKISVEVNPNDVVELNAIDYIDPKKVKRVSMGVQSFKGERLRELGRAVLPERNYEAIEIIMSKKYCTFNIDLVWGLEDISDEAEEAFSLKVDQVTFYPLMPFPGRGPRAEAKAFEIYENIVKVAKSYGYVRSNAWTFSKGKGMVDEYIADAPQFLGLGVSSFSFINGWAHVNVFDVDEYFERGWFPAWHSLKMRSYEERAFKLAMNLHSTAFGWDSEFLWYLGMVTLREIYSALGEFRQRNVAEVLARRRAPPSLRASSSRPSRARKG